MANNYNSSPVFLGGQFAPFFSGQYSRFFHQDRKTESYYFSYVVHLREDLVTNLYISIREDFSIKYISGLPDKSYNFPPCTIMSKEKLWTIAKKNGLKGKFQRCSYSLFFEEEAIYIAFYQPRSRWSVDNYSLNAITGKYQGHTQMNLNF